MIILVRSKYDYDISRIAFIQTGFSIAKKYISEFFVPMLLLSYSWLKPNQILDTAWSCRGMAGQIFEPQPPGADWGDAAPDQSSVYDSARLQERKPAGSICQHCFGSNQILKIHSSTPERGILRLGMHGIRLRYMLHIFNYVNRGRPHPRRIDYMEKSWYCPI